MTTLSTLQVHAIIWFLTKSSAVIRDFSYLTRFLVERGSTVDIFVLNNIFLVLAMLRMEPRALLANAVHGTLLPDHQPLLGGGSVMFTGQCQAKWQTLRAEKGARQEWWGILSLVGRNRLWLLGKFPCSSLQQWGSDVGRKSWSTKPCGVLAPSLTSFFQARTLPPILPVSPNIPRSQGKRW